MPTPKRKQSPRNCIICDVIFIPQRCIAKCCSLSCRIKYMNIVRSEIKKEWSIQNKDKVRAAQKRWVVTNPDKRKKASASYIKRNLSYYAQYAALYTRRLLQAKPKWADEKELNNIYCDARQLGLEVDHIIPLKHPLVCGLHVPLNLQLLSRSENARKSNKFNHSEV